MFVVSSNQPLQLYHSGEASQVLHVSGFVIEVTDATWFISAPACRNSSRQRRLRRSVNRQSALHRSHVGPTVNGC